MPSTIAASGALSAGRINPFSLASLHCIAIDKQPFTVLTRPSNASSPTIPYSSILSVSIWFVAMSSPVAMDSSKEGPSFFLSAGARLMVMFL